MKLRTKHLSSGELREIADDLGIRVEIRNRRELRGGPDKGATEYHFGLRPVYGEDAYRLIRDGMSGRRRVNAVCWHGHYDFMDEVFARDPDARIISAVATYNGRRGFLQDAPPTAERNIGSQFYPQYYGDACECGRGWTPPPMHLERRPVTFGTLEPSGRLTEVRTIPHAEIRACPHAIMVPEHYRPDGSCRCDDRSALEMADWGYWWSERTGRWEVPENA